MLKAASIQAALDAVRPARDKILKIKSGVKVLIDVDPVNVL